jgi:hypothetical protein
MSMVQRKLKSISNKVQKNDCVVVPQQFHGIYPARQRPCVPWLLVIHLGTCLHQIKTEMTAS